MNNPIVAILFNLLMNPIVWGGIILLIVFLVKSKKSKTDDVQTDASVPETQNEAPTASADSASSYSGTSKIFVNGGMPSSGNTMGKITVDGKSLSLLYTDAPIEITIPAGSHHIVVEGGVYGDARIDRVMELGASDVWTVDMPGGDDEDVIRHQKISYSEYRKALSDSGFTVTRKQI